MISSEEVYKYIGKIVRYKLRYNSINIEKLYREIENSFKENDLDMFINWKFISIINDVMYVRLIFYDTDKDDFFYSMGLKSYTNYPTLESYKLEIGRLKEIACSGFFEKYEAKRKLDHLQNMSFPRHIEKKIYSDGEIIVKFDLI